MKIAIAGLGNIGIAAQKAAESMPEFEVKGLFSRRESFMLPDKFKSKVYSFSEIAQFKDEVDVVINCMGSAFDLPVTTPYLAKYFNVVDSFDNHSRFKEHIVKTEHYASQSGKLALVGCGWDPGLFSLARAVFASCMPKGSTYTFWGEGISQGHSNAVKNIEGVIDAVEYTVPIKEAMEKVRAGDTPDFEIGQMHKRVCYVVLEAGTDPERIKNEIVSMPAYFAPYDTEVNFIDYETFLCDHSTHKHEGTVIRSEKADGESFVGEFSLKMTSNPSFTAQILLRYALAVYKMNKEGKSGCITVFDIAPSKLFSKTSDELSLI